jgi:hypothetical protein
MWWQSSSVANAVGDEAETLGKEAIVSTDRSAVFPFVATGWVMLWALLSLANGGFHADGSRGLGFPVIVIGTGWLLAWLRSDAITVIALRQPGQRTFAALGLVPIILVGILPLIDHSGRGAAAIHTNAATNFLKVALFCAPWSLLFLRMRESIGAAEPPEAQHRTVQSAPVLTRHRAKTDTLFVPIGDVARPVRWDQIIWLEADGNYVRIFTHETDYFYRCSLGDVLGELGEDRFVRIHKSRAVNLAEIAGIQPLGRGDAELRLRNGQKLRMSRRFRSDLVPPPPRS